MVMDMVMATATDTTATMARGRLSLLPLLLPLLSPDMATTATDMVMDMAMDTVMATDTDTTATTARGRLSLPPLLRLLLSPDMATTATATATARGRLLPSPDTDTAATATMDTVMDTDMATDTAMAMATMDREGTDCVSNHDVKSSVKAAMKFCC